MQNPLVSVILPNFNCQQYIAETIRSVLNQTYKNIELLIIDDCSTDESVNVIHETIKNDQRARLIKLEQNYGGPATPRNIGIKQSKGIIISFIDSDDIWFPKKLEIQINDIKNKKYSFVSSHKYNFSGESPKSFPDRKQAPYLQFKYGDLLKKNLVNTSTVTVKKELLENEEFDTKKELIAVEDYALWLNILKNKKVKVSILQEPLVYYRLLNTSISTSKVKQAKKVLLLLKDQQLSGIQRLYYFLNYALRSVLYSLKRR